MDKIIISEHKKFVDDFLKEYLENGFSVMPKREVDILVFNLLLKYGGLIAHSNHALSIMLQTPESKIRSYGYEARLRYPPDENYIRREFLIVLGRAQFQLDKKDADDIEKMKIIFAIEDKFLRHAILGRLKEKGMFADTSFNREIVKIECSSLIDVIEELYDEEIASNFKDGFEVLKDSKNKISCSELVLDFVLATAKSIFEAVVVSEIKSRLGML